MHDFFSEHGYGGMKMSVYKNYVLLTTPSLKEANQFIQDFDGFTVNKCKLDVKLFDPPRSSNDNFNYDQSYMRKQSPVYGRDQPLERNSYYDREPPYGSRDNQPRGRDMGYSDYPPSGYPPRDMPPRNYDNYDYREKDYPPRRDKYEPPRPDYRDPRDIRNIPYGGDPRYHDDYSHDPRRYRNPDETKTIKITNMPDDCNEADLFRLFYPSGFIRHVERRGDIGYVQFDTIEDARTAIYEMDGYKINNLHLRVEYHPDIPWLGLPRLFIPLYLIEKDGSISQKPEAQ